MRFGSTVVVSAFVVACSIPAVASPHARRGPTCQHLTTKKSSPLAHKPVAQRAIDSDRTTQIQTALIGRGYLDGSATGTWTPETEDALRKFQADNGWQTKMVPDSRAIIKLGLGPASPATDGVAATASVAPVAPESDAATSAQQ